MMDDRKLTDIYSAKVTGNETIDGRNTYVLELTAKVDDAAYYSQKIWVDTERFVPLKQEMFAKSGQLLKAYHPFRCKTGAGTLVPDEYGLQRCT